MVGVARGKTSLHERGERGKVRRVLREEINQAPFVDRNQPRLSRLPRFWHRPHKRRQKFPEWLAEGGRFFLVCPNANAPSRQIAVKMGLITHNAAVTPAEAEHGHRCTYSLDTLERDANAAGLKIMHRSGIFFKALANFQWDRLLDTDIISKEYLEGCYKLGQHYPDLCSSIFLMCERGDSQK